MSDDFETRLLQEKLDAMKELAYGASHEINNPLANISARAQTLLRDETHPERRAALEAIRQQAMRAHEMISDLMLFARPPALRLEEFELGELLAEIANRFEATCAQRSVLFTLKLPDTLPPLTGDPQQLTVAIDALCSNALEAIGTDGVIELSCQTIQSPPALQIEVTDTGPGLSDRVRRHLFDPFFSGREAGRGLGFGLSKCWRIITEHGGTLVVHSQAGEGSTFTVQLPLQGS